MKEQIKKDIVTAMKEGNAVAKDILRVLKGEIERNEQSSKGKIELSDTEIVSIIKKLIQSVKDSGEDNGEIEVLEKYLPKQMSESEITEKVNTFVVTNGIDSMKGIGQIMNHFKENYAGQYDGKSLSLIVKDVLS